MGGLAHYLEEEGVATTQISLIREHTEILTPPRALWVPFELGRPFGVPHNPPFQSQVLLSALELLEAQIGPVLEDFPIDAPISDSQHIQVACPVHFVASTENKSEIDTLLQAFQSEVSQIQTWYDLGIQINGRTTAGLSGLTLSEIFSYLSAIVQNHSVNPPIEGESESVAIKMASEDLKAFYFEAVAAQPGSSKNSQALQDWFWSSTAAARILYIIREMCLERPGNEYQLLGKLLLVPRMQLFRFKK